MKENYKKVQPYVLVYEGGKVDDLDDPGGRTNQGVTQRVFSAFLRKKGMAGRDVFTMTIEEREAIYKVQYWDRVRGDNLPSGVDFVLYDGAVNSGVAQSIKWLQRSLGVIADGVLGEITLNAIFNHPDHDALIASILARRMLFLKALKIWYKYKNGWTARVKNVLKNAQALASGSVGPKPIYSKEGSVKATIKDARISPARAPADMLASGGAVTTTITTVQNTLEPLSATPWVSYVINVLIIVGVIAGVAGLAYGLYARRKKAELDDALDLAIVRVDDDV